MSDYWEEQAREDVRQKFLEQARANVLDDADPAAARAASRTGNALGLPPSTILADPKGFEREAQFKETDLALENSPELARFFVDPDNARAGKDDITPLSDLSNQFSVLGSFGMKKPTEPYSFDAPPKPFPNYRVGTPAPQPKRRVGTLEGRGASMLGVAMGGVRDIEASIYDVAGQGDEFRQSEYYKTGGSQLEQLREISDRPLEQIENSWLPDPLKYAGAFGYKGSRAATDMLPYLAARGYAVGVMGSAAGLEGYNRFRERGAGVFEAATAGTVTGVAEYAFEKKFGLGWMLGNWGKRATLSFVGGMLGREVPSELATTFVQSLADALTTGGKGLAKFWEDLPSELRETAEVTVGMVGTMGVAHRAMRLAMPKLHEKQEARAALEGAAFLDQAMRTAEGSKLRKEEPDRFRTFAKDTAAKSPVTHVYIPIAAIDAALADETLPEEEKAALSVYQEQIEEARLNPQADVVIPIEDALTSFPGTKIWKVLEDDARLLGGGLSPREAREVKGMPEELEAIGKKIMEEARAAAPANEAKAKVHEEVEKAVLAMGRSAKEAKHHATVWASRAENVATKRYGQFKTIDEAWKAMKLKFYGPDGKPKAIGKQGQKLAQGPSVNIGLNTNVGGKITERKVLAALKKIGVKVSEKAVHKSTTEDTLVANLDRTLTKEETDALAIELEQDAIAYHDGTQGYLDGPNIANFGGKFDPQYYMDLEGKTATALQQSAAALQALALQITGTGSGGRVLNRDLGEALTQRHMDKYGRALDPSNPEDYAIALQAMIEDYQEQQAQPDNGEAWYDEDVAEAIAISTEIIPELADPVHRDLFLTIAAILSPKQKPTLNWENAILAMQGYLRPGGRIALRKPNGKQFGIKAQTTGLQVLQHLIDTLGSVEAAALWVKTPQTGAAMAEVRKASGLFTKKDKLGGYLPGETNLNETKLGIYMMGPKVGDFMQNSVGIDQNAVTVDLWLARTYNRIIGRLMDVAPKAKAAGGIASDVRGRAERDNIKKLVRDAAKQAGIAPSAMQAALWYFEQRLYRNHGIKSESQNFSGAAKTAVVKRGLDPERGAAQRSAERSARAAAANAASGIPEDENGFPLEDVLSSEGDGTTDPLTYHQFGGEVGAPPPVEAPVFYSAAQRVIEAAQQVKATAQQWMALLTPGKTPGIKADEIEWSGVHDWLKMQQGPVEKDALLDFLRSHGIKVEEVVLGDKADVDAYLDMMRGDERFEGQSEEDLRAQLDYEQNGPATQFQAYSSDPSNPTYRELLITLPPGVAGNPDRAPSTHFDTEGVVVHVRFMEKTDADGKRVLFIEEVQSDWHQKGRDQGYEARTQDIESARQVSREANAAWGDWHKRVVALGVPEDSTGPVAVLRDMAAQGSAPANIDELIEEGQRLGLRVQEAQITVGAAESGGIPNAPFKSSWPALVMKRMIVWASREGYDKIAWTTGAEQNERYNLTQAVGMLSVARRAVGDETMYEVLPGNPSVNRILLEQFPDASWGNMDNQNSVLMNETNLAAAFGADIRDRLVSRAPENGEYSAPIQGDDLKIGGEGMKAFYDRNLVNITNDIVKKYGAKVRLLPVNSEEAKEKTRKQLLAQLQREAGLAAYGIGSVEEARQRIADYRTRDNAESKAWVAQLEAAMPTIEQLEGLDARDAALTNPGFEITDKMRDAAMGGMPLFQDQGTGPRGEATFYPSGRTTIQLFSRANFSTMLHETSHVFLQQEFTLAKHPKASEELKADVAALTKWFEANGGGLDENGMPNREAHELFARTGERYFRAGKAPSAELRPAFKQFSTWLKGIYQTVQDLLAHGPAPINPEIREIMDRMIATEEAIEANATTPMSQEQLGMTTAEYAAYLESVAEAKDIAHDTLLERMMKAIRTRETARGREQRANVKAEVAKEVNAQPEFIALHLLRTGRWLGEPERERTVIKIHTGWLIDNYGEDVLKALPVGLQPLHRGDGVVGDEIAELVGMPSGDALVQALLGLKSQADQLKADGNPRPLRDHIIEERTNQRMAESEGDIMSQEQIEEEAIAALNSNRQGEILAAELRQLRKKNAAPGVITPYQLLREWARRKVNEGTVADAVSKSALQRYVRGFNRARAAFEDAILDGKADEAIKQKQAQMINHALLAEGKVVADEIDAIVRRMKRYASIKAMASIDQDYMDRIHELLEGYNFRNVSDRARAEQTSFEEWAAKQRELGHEVHAPERFRDDRTNWKDAQVAKLLELNDMIQSLAAQGKLKQRLTSAREERELQQVIDDAESRILNLPPRALPEASTGQESRPLRQALREAKTFADYRAAVGRLFSRQKAREFASGLIKVEGLMDLLDGSKDAAGPMNLQVVQPATEAANTFSQLLEEVMGPIIDRYRGMSRKQAARLRDFVTIPELTLNVSIHEADSEKLGQPLTIPRMKLLGLIANTGNLSNLSKLVAGERWGDHESATDLARVRDILISHASKEDLDLVQDMWNGVAKLWPHIARVEREMSGIVPEEVVPMEFETPYGTYSGGYWPVVWDRTRSVMGQKQGEEAETSVMGVGFGIGTPKGHTITRTGAAAPMEWSIEAVLFGHMNKVISRIAYAPWIRDVLKVVDSPRISGAIRLRLGDEYVRMIKPWIRDQIPSNWQDTQGAAFWEKFLNGTRVNMSITVLGVAYSTGVAQLLGLGYSAGVLGEGSIKEGGKWMAIGIAKAVQLEGLGYGGAQEFVFSRSVEMQRRAHEVNQEATEVFRRLKDKDTFYRRAQAKAFWHIGFIDLNMVAIPTWMGGYHKALSQGQSEQEAIDYAEKTVRLSQSSGRKKDLSAIQRGNAGQKFIAMFYTPSSVFFNQQWEAAQHLKAGNWSNALAPTFWFLVMTTIADAMREGDWPEDDDEDGLGGGDIAEWVGRNILFGMFYGIPVVRDATNAAERKIRGEYSEYGTTPLTFAASTIERGYKSAKKVVEGEETEGRDLKNAVAAVGFLFGLPGNQIGKTSGFIEDVRIGKAEPEGFGDWFTGLTSGKLKEDKESQR